MPVDKQIAKAGAALRDGALVAFPTETVYGLGGDATNARAVAEIFSAKGRPQFNPLIVHVASLAAARELGQFSAAAEKLARAFWPGPLTLVVRRRRDCPICDLATAGLDTLAIRVPAHRLAQALLKAAQVPIAAPSANRSGHISPTSAAHVRQDLGDRVAIILDGGPCRIGLESTIIDATDMAAAETAVTETAVTEGLTDAAGDGLTMLRPGGLNIEAIEATSGLMVSAVRPRTSGGAPRSPGQLASHYAPRASLRLNAAQVDKNEALLAFGTPPSGHCGLTINLSPAGDLVEAAAALYAALRALDAMLRDSAGATDTPDTTGSTGTPGATGSTGSTGASGPPGTMPASIAVMPIPDEGLGAAINDRLRRAAAPRPART